MTRIPIITIDSFGANYGNASVPMDTLCHALNELTGTGESTGELIFPNGMRYVYSHGNIQQMGVIEIPHGVYGLRWYIFPPNGNSYVANVRIALPYTILVFSKFNGYIMVSLCYFSNSPLTSLDQPIHLATLPNCSAYNINGVKPLLCSSRNSVRYTRKDIANSARELRNEFFASAWGKYGPYNDIYTTYGGDGCELIKPIDRWVENTSKDPGFITRVAWGTPFTTLRYLAITLPEWGNLYSEQRPGPSPLHTLAAPIFTHNSYD